MEKHDYENILKYNTMPDDRMDSETGISLYWPLNFHKSPHEALRFYTGIRHYVGSLTHNTNGTKKENSPILMAVKFDETRLKEMCHFNRHYYEYNRYNKKSHNVRDKQLKDNELATIVAWETNPETTILYKDYLDGRTRGWDFTAWVDYKHIADSHANYEFSKIPPNEDWRKYYDPIGFFDYVDAVMDYDSLKINYDIQLAMCPLRVRMDNFYVVRRNFVYKDYEEQKRIMEKLINLTHGLKNPHYTSEVAYAKVYLTTLAAYVKGIAPDYIKQTMNDYDTADYKFDEEEAPLTERRKKVLRDFELTIETQFNKTGLLVEQIPTNVPERLTNTKPGLLEMLPSKI